VEVLMVANKLSKGRVPRIPDPNDHMHSHTTSTFDEVSDY